ncbi:MAG: helix-turn-helix domain-containing protein [Actinophytocola sp.]|uniref:helix-turn-helix domain-containing protein n=1 Tax=Actinophytocola sp. TaxID=1872138 RepID=UPI001322C3F3|nr:helix-turn-helix transcriptional regulator [Actinophytocola sp.]MPZ84426.1 helix-turn-helix domain-containing protein [Actinophytocola sp.]
MNIAELIKTRRTERGLTQADLAAQAGVDKRQIRRYEVGEVQPTLSVAPAIARALDLTLDELAGEAGPRRVDLAGDWWASWQTSKDGEEVITALEVRMTQRADHIEVQTTTRGIDVEDGGYHWRGELRLWDNELLMGWYAAAEGGVRSKGTMYFVLHPHGVNMRGRWVGLSYDGKIQTGWGAVGKSEEDARAVIEELKRDAGT